ncbi:Cytosolic sulfotransferase 15 [Linum perenne]
MPTSSNKEQGEENLISLECQKLLLSLPREKGWRTPYIYKFQGFWCQPKQIQAILAFQAHFQVKDTDVIVATIPKSGTTWLKALVFAITNPEASLQCPSDHPLLVSNPHDLVPFFEYKVYASSNPLDVDLSGLSDPRLFATHIPFRALQESIRKSGCKIVYVCRNPFDTFISSWKYCNKLKGEGAPPLPLEEAFEMYCKGVVGYGPFWEHMLGYWNESQERPEKVLFFKYEDMKEDVGSHVRKLAEFLGCPFSKGEEEEGLVGEIARLCSFEKLKELEVNKVGKAIMNFENKHLFRKGEVGDWVNHLSPWMVDKLAQVMDEKLGGSGLKFKTFNS